MKYNSLQDDIINILHSDDYDLYLKFYDEDGNNTYESSNAKWCYIANYNLMIEFMSDSSPLLSIWKGTTPFNNNMKNILQRIRQLCNLNGITVEIYSYNNLSKRKIYNLVKSEIYKLSQKDETMNESLYNMIQISQKTKKPVDNYMSSEMKSTKSLNLLSEMLDQVSTLPGLEKHREELNHLLSVHNLSETIECSKSFSKPLIKALKENSSNIKMIPLYVKNCYLNNVEPKKIKSLFFMDNSKISLIKENRDRENLIQAYNKLVQASSDVKSGTDLIRNIKKLNLCEEYNVSRKDILDFWLSKSTNTPIEDKKAFVIETSKGDEIMFSDNLSSGIKHLASYINNGGKKDDEICQNIIKETIKFDEIASFIKEYSNSYHARKFIPQFKELFVETANKFTSKFDENNFKSFENIAEGEHLIESLSNEMGLEHPALKYLAHKKFIEMNDFNGILMEACSRDEKIILDGMRKYNKSLSECYKVINTFFNVKKCLNEANSVNSSNYKEIANKLFESLEDKTSPLASALFNIIHSKNKITQKKIEFLNTIKKYM